MAEDKKISAEFVKLQEDSSQKDSPTVVRRPIGLLLLTIALAISNAYLFMNNYAQCHQKIANMETLLESSQDSLDTVQISLEATQVRIGECLYQRSIEMVSREDILGECIAELKTTELELEMYKNDEE